MHTLGEYSLFTQGITPLYIACQEGHASTVRALLKGKANPNKRNKVPHAFTPGCAVTQVIQLAPSMCAQNGGLPLGVATVKAETDVMRVLLEDSVKKCDLDKMTLVRLGRG